MPKGKKNPRNSKENTTVAVKKTSERHPTDQQYNTQKSKVFVSQTRPKFGTELFCTSDIQYLGCYIDNSDRMLDKKTSNGNMTLEMCVQLCNGHRYLGLQDGIHVVLQIRRMLSYDRLALTEYSSQCFCGDSLGDSVVYNKTNDSECNQECLGNSSQICGGNWRNSVYEYINCTAPGLNEYTISSTTTDVVPSTEVTYTCEFGYQLPVGDLGTRICQLGGTWPAPPPACEVIKCTAPGLNEYTITSTNTDVVPSTEVTYTCEFGYQLPPGDLGTRICQLGGTWPALPPACEVPPTSTTEILTSVVTSIVTSTELTTSEASTVITTELATLETPTVTTTELATLGTSTLTTEPTVKTSELSTDWTVTTILKKSEVTTVQPISPLKCLCPCSQVGKGKWDFVRGMNLTLDQSREILKPELDLIKKELTINKSNTTRMRRTKISAPDDRVSATSVGYVGVVFICLITVLIVFLDRLGCLVSKFQKRS
ncbi:unnamed protein product [Mytilus coruscus]|uniref:CSMD n=1 Tax=Mytilus coruscus TaxID=42192 RepID=A0A6J8EXU7_MYTCO|nr:unnamed protein product [Mytilus coruscus]